jgi:hypothetical protein
MNVSSPQSLGLLARLWLALVLPWRVIFSGATAGRVAGALQPPSSASPDGEGDGSSDNDGKATTEPEKIVQAATPTPVIEAQQEPDFTPALQLLSIMQREGRLIDFLQEDVSGASDADIGAAARVVHEGCGRGLSEHLTLEPIRREQEGDQVVLEAGFDAARTMVTGNIVGSPPFKGRLAHHGWRVRDLRLPTITQGHDPSVVAPAEVEL